MTVQADTVRLLIVEDNDAHARLAEKVLDSLGYLCTRAASAEQAFDVIAADLPDLLWMDLLSPGMSGLDAVGRLRCWRARRNN